MHAHETCQSRFHELDGFDLKALRSSHPHSTEDEEPFESMRLADIFQRVRRQRQDQGPCKKPLQRDAPAFPNFTEDMRAWLDDTSDTIDCKTPCKMPASSGRPHALSEGRGGRATACLDNTKDQERRVFRKTPYKPSRHSLAA